MKVLLLITKSNFGGAQRYVYDLATHLPKDTYSVTVMAGGNGPLIEKLTAAGIKADGSLPIGRDVSILGDINAFIQIFKIILAERPDVLHVNSSKMGGMGAFAGRLLGVKNIIFTAHGWSFNENRSLASKLIIKAVHWFTIKLSHKTILVSNALRNQIENWPFISGKFHIVRNGIDNMAMYSKINARYELGKINSNLDKIIKYSEKNLVLIGSVGELHHIKGYEYALNGIEGLISEFKKTHPEKRILYTIMGEGENRINIEKEVERLDLKESVILLGNVPNAFQYMRAFDIFLMPSLSEGLPYALLEAGLAGLPIVASAVGGIPEVIEDMKSGVLIQPRKSKEIRHALEFFILHKRMRSDYSKSLSERVLHEFSIQKMVAETIEVYRH